MNIDDIKFKSVGDSELWGYTVSCANKIDSLIKKNKKVRYYDELGNLYDVSDIKITTSKKELRIDIKAWSLNHSNNDYCWIKVFNVFHYNNEFIIFSTQKGIEYLFSSFFIGTKIDYNI